jgi:hypothetical protein
MNKLQIVNSNNFNKNPNYGEFGDILSLFAL